MTKAQEAQAQSTMHDQLLLLQGKNVPDKAGDHSGLKIMAVFFCAIPVVIGFVYVMPSERDEDIQVIGAERYALDALVCTIVLTCCSCSDNGYGAAEGGAQVHNWRV
jgi:hypothetical protein